jgi:hypothetical protein
MCIDGIPRRFMTISTCSCNEKKRKHFTNEFLRESEVAPYSTFASYFYLCSFRKWRMSGVEHSHHRARNTALSFPAVNR